MSFETIALSDLNCPVPRGALTAKIEDALRLAREDKARAVVFFDGSKHTDEKAAVKEAAATAAKLLNHLRRHHLRDQFSVKKSGVKVYLWSSTP